MKLFSRWRKRDGEETHTHNSNNYNKHKSVLTDGLYNRLKSSNIRECVRTARLARNDSAHVNRIIDTFAKYGITRAV